MKKTLLSLLGLGLMFSANAQNPFAYGLSSDNKQVAWGEMTVDVTYSLNTDADEVVAQIFNNKGEEVRTQDLTDKTKGTHTVALNLYGLTEGNYTWAIKVTGGATSGDPTLFNTWSFYHPCGLDVDNSPESPSFGTIFVADGYTSGKTSGYISAQADGSDGGGLYMFTPDLVSITNKDGGYRFFKKDFTQNYKDMYTVSSTGKPSYFGADFSKVAVDDEGRIFVTRYNFQGDYILYAESVKSLQDGGDFKSLVERMDMTDTKVYNDENGDFLLGPIQSFDVKGSGENTKLLAMTRASNDISIGTSLNRVVEYSLGKSEALSTAESFVALDKKYTISYDKSANVAYDKRGGVWYCQYRGTPDDSNPALVYIDANGNTQYFEGLNGKSRQRAALAVSPDGTMLAASSGKAGLFSLYNINYAEDGSVTLTEIKQLDISTSANPNVYSATWDCAGNVYAGNATNEWVKGYAVPRADNSFATPASSKYPINITANDVATGVEGIAVDENVPVEYYNLQGVKVENPSNGIFIRKQGTKTTKVVL